MAQERKKRRIVLASVLKPVDDTRMFEKMGATLAESGDYDVFILGYPSYSSTSSKDIKLIPHKAFRRISLSRIMVRLQILKKLFSLRPDLLIFNTHELISIALVAKVILNVRIIYDVRENHYRNILYSGSFPLLIRMPLALLVRFKEKFLAPAIDHFILAEKCYEEEFRFHRGGWTVIENKSMILFQDRRKEPGKIRLLFSGTLSESTGVFEAISVARQLHQLDPSVHLHVAGFASLSETREKIRKLANENSWISLTGIDELVPHAVIVSAIRNADAGFLLYPDSPHTSGSRPTKLFEYLTARLPILLEKKWKWVADFQPCNPFIVIELQSIQAQSILDKIRSESFYSIPPANVSWPAEGNRLLNTLNKLA